MPMHSGDKPEFDIQLERLCAGFGVPVGDRYDAYWSGLSKMSLIEFSRVIDFSLSPDYQGKPDRPPNVPQCWNILRELKRPQQPVQSPASQKQLAQEKLDHIEYFANRLLLHVFTDRQGFGSESKFMPGHGMIDCAASPLLQSLLDMKRALVAWYVQPILDGDEIATPVAFVREFEREAAKFLTVNHAVKTKWDRMCEDPYSHRPFEKSMARPLPQMQAAV